MNLYLYNTLSREKEKFEPINKDNVGMYVCGPTVYDRAHIGNARPVVVFDTLYRVLKELYSSVCYVRNITDVDDKIIIRSQEKGVPIDVITKETTEFFHQDMAELNALSPDVEPRATEHIKEMISLVQKLIDEGHAYEAEGHVLFSVSSMKDYGKLSRRTRDELIAGARVEVAPYKQDYADFVLWKPSEEGQPGWDSPWGNGRPGWHLECSAMSSKYLGDSFDIHGGGQDLVFPHHENEIAQSCCAHKDELYAKYWVHNGHLMVDGKKMSKSLGNFFTVQEILEKVPGEVARYYILSTHYHQPLDWTNDGLMNAKKSLDRFYQALRNVDEVALDKNTTYSKEVLEALCDDINTPKAISILHEIVSELNKAETDKEKSVLKTKLIKSAHFLGVLEKTPEEWFKWSPKGLEAEGLSDNEIEEMIIARANARKNKDFAEADRIREDLKDKGVILEDSSQGTTWKRT